MFTLGLAVGAVMGALALYAFLFIEPDIEE